MYYLVPQFTEKFSILTTICKQTKEINSFNPLNQLLMIVNFPNRLLINIDARRKTHFVNL